MNARDSAPDAVTLVFGADNYDGSIDGASPLIGVAVKAAVGVSIEQSPGREWLSLYDERFVREASRLGRDAQFELLRAAISGIGSRFFRDLTVDGHRLGRTWLMAAWSPLEHALSFLVRWRAFLQAVRPARVYTWRMADAPPHVVEALRMACAQENLELEHLPAAPREAPPQADPGRPCHPEGVYELMGTIGREEIFYRAGMCRGFSPAQATDAGLVLQLPWSTDFPSDTQGVFVEAKIDHVYAPRQSICLDLALAARSITIEIRADGIFLSRRGRLGRFREMLSPGPIDATHPGFAVWLTRRGAGFAELGRPARPLRLHRSRGKPGVTIATSPGGDSFLRWSRFAIVRNPDERALVTRAIGLAALFESPYPPPIERPRLFSWLSSLGSRLAPPAAAPQTCAVEPKPVIGVPIASREYMLSYTPGTGFDNSPFYFEGLIRSLHQAGYATCPVRAGAPWIFGPEGAAGGVFLFGEPHDEATQQKKQEAHALLQKTLDGLLEDIARSALGFAGFSVAPLLAFVLDRQKEALVGSFDSYLASIRTLRDRQFCAVLGPRLDSAYQYVADCAWRHGSPVHALELSFYAHPVMRLHLFHDLPEHATGLHYWGKDHIGELRQLGLDAPEHRSSGLHSLDHYRRARESRMLLRNRQQEYWSYLGFPGVDPPVVLLVAHYGSSVPYYDTDCLRRTLAAIEDAFAAIGRGTAVVKLIPTDHAGIVQTVASRIGSGRIRMLCPVQPFHNLQYVLGADLAVGIPTTFLAEAAVAGVPCATLVFDTLQNWFPVYHRQIAKFDAFAPVVRSRRALFDRIVDLPRSREWLAVPGAEAASALRSLFGDPEGGNLSRVMQEVAAHVNASSQSRTRGKAGPAATTGISKMRDSAIAPTAPDRARLDRYHEYLTSAFGETLLSRAGKEAASRLVPLLWREPRCEAPCDVLMLHAAPATRAAKADFVASLRARGLTVIERDVAPWSEVLRERLLGTLDYAPPPRLALKASYARFLVAAHRPRVLVTFTEDLLASFLRFETGRAGGTHVNCAHSIVFATDSFTMADFDYYFLFGQASLDSLRRNPARYGATRVVLTGTVSLPARQPLAAVPPNDTVLYFSTWIANRHREAHLAQFRDVVSFARRNPGRRLHVKLHPLEDHGFWKETAARLPNVFVLDRATPLAAALGPACLTLSSSGSTTALDSILMNRLPLVLDQDAFGSGFYRAYPGLGLRPGESIEEGIGRMLADHAHYMAQAREFLDANLAHGFDSVEVAADRIFSLARGREDFAFLDLASAFP